jgi:hypothetical protein
LWILSEAFLLLTEGSTPEYLRAASLIIKGGGGAERLYTSLVKVFFSVDTIFLLLFWVSHWVFDFPLDMTVVCAHCGAVSLLLLPKLPDTILRN